MIARPVAVVAAVVAALVVVAASSVTARANPRPLPRSEPYETLIEDRLEVEQQLDAVAVRIARETAEGGLEAVWSLRADLRTELRLGWNDRLELGLAVRVRQDARARGEALVLGGLEQRARLRLFEAGDAPVDLAVQVALAEGSDGLGLAQRLVVQRRFDTLVAVANLELEQRYGFTERAWAYAYQVSAGAAVELSPRISVGAEYWVRARLDDVRGTTAELPDDPRAGAIHYGGPSALIRRGRLWLAAAAYARLDVRTVAAGDPFGRLWVRAVLGLEL